MNEFIQDREGLIRQECYRKDQNKDASRTAIVPARPTLSKNATTADHVDAVQSPPHEKEITVRPRTKYEQTILNRIPERQKANLVKPKITNGKIYTGAGFLPNPTTIHFTDFVVGQVYKKTFEFTNVSPGFNAFKAQPMPPNVRDVFDLVYTPQSMMSAGMSTTITLIFSPKENLDINTVVPILAQTGMIEVPVVCTRKRCIVSVNSKKIDFKGVVVAEKSVHTLTLKNDGALPTKFRISGDFLEKELQMTQTDANGEAHRVFSLDPEVNVRKPASITLHPFSVYQMVITYNPVEVCSFESSLYFAFDNDEVDDLVVFMEGSAIDVPVFVSDNSVIDLECCFYGTLYRDKFTVKNTTRSAVKVTPEVPNCLAGGMLEYVPKFGFVQPESTFDFQIKFTPNEGLGSFVDQSMKISVSDQSMPIFYQLKAFLSHRKISFDPPELQFGTCTLGESLSLPLKITNHCELVRRIGFVKVPNNLKVFPESLFNIGPNESVTLMVSVTPATHGISTQSVQLRTEHDEMFNLPITCHGKPSPLSFEFPNLLLPSTTIGCSVSVTTTLTNVSQTVQRYSFCVNSKYCVTISPTNGELAKGESIPVVVTFLPTKSAVDLTLPEIKEITPTVVEFVEPVTDDKGKSSRAGTESKMKKMSKAEEDAERKEKERVEEEQRQERDRQVKERDLLVKEFSSLEKWEESFVDRGEVWSKHRTLLVPCYLEGWSSKAIFLSVRCTVVKPTIMAKVVVLHEAEVKAPPPKPVVVAPVAAAAAKTRSASVVSTSLSPKPVEPEVVVVATIFASATTIDFKSVPADRAVKKTVLIKNFGDKDIFLRLTRLDPFGPFAILKPPLAVLKPRQQCEALVQFLPQTKAKYKQEWVISCVGGNSLSFSLEGEGLPAALSVSTDRNAQQSTKEIAVAFGTCLANDKAEQPLFLTNLSPFPLTIETSLTKLVNLNANATCPFSIQPPCFTIPANGKMEVIVAFAPTIDGFFSAVAVMEFGGHGSTQRIELTGTGCEKGMYIEFPKEGGFGSSEALTRRDVFNVFGDAPAALGSTPASPIILAFSAAEGKVAQIPVVIGNNKGSANGEITVEGLTDADVKMGWKVDVLKAAVVAGARVTIQISFSPTVLLLDSLPIPKIGVVTVCNTRFVIKGGTPASDVVYFVRLKGTGWK